MHGQRNYLLTYSFNKQLCEGTCTKVPSNCIKQEAQYTQPIASAMDSELKYVQLKSWLGLQQQKKDKEQRIWLATLLVRNIFLIL